MGRNRSGLWTLAGLVSGAALGLWLWRRGAKRAPEPIRWTGPGDAAARIRQTFDRDAELATRLRVHAVSEGVVEITGRVAGRRQRDRAVAVAHNTDGVHTVVNRIVLEPEEARLEENRVRNADGSTGRQHYGMGVGMGTRRQSPDTDPDRPSDRQKLVERELDVDRVRENPGDPEDDVGPGSEAGSRDPTSRD